MAIDLSTYIIHTPISTQSSVFTLNSIFDKYMVERWKKLKSQLFSVFFFFVFTLKCERKFEWSIISLSAGILVHFHSLSSSCLMFHIFREWTTKVYARVPSFTMAEHCAPTSTQHIKQHFKPRKQEKKKTVQKILFENNVDKLLH